MTREIKFRAWVKSSPAIGTFSKPYMSYESNHILFAWLNDGVGLELMQYTNHKDKNGKEVYQSDIIEFWLIYPTSQTHTGDNIPGGSYTEPDETQFVKVRAEVIFDEERGMWSYSIIGKVPYNFHESRKWITGEDNVIPIINRPVYNEYEIAGYYGITTCVDNPAFGRNYAKPFEEPPVMDNPEFLEIIKEHGFNSISEMMKEINEFEVIGNIFEQLR